MFKYTLYLSVLCLLLCSYAPIAALKGPLGNEIALKLPVDDLEAELMKALFGNYYPRIKASALDKDDCSDIELMRWITLYPFQDRLWDWDDLDAHTQAEFKAMQGKIPIGFLELFKFPNKDLLLVFEAGGWEEESTWWGGTGFTASHNLGMAAFSCDSGCYKLSGYDLNLGRYGTYRSTRLAKEPIRIGQNDYAVMTQDIDSALFAVIDGQPVEILRIPHFVSMGHGSDEDFSSKISFDASNARYYDVIVSTKGWNDRSDYELHFLRRWSWNDQAQRYDLVVFQGNIQSILENPDYWLLEDDFD